MAVFEIIPSTNVSMADIRDTLNANGGSVTNVLGTFFGDSAKINKWAKFKPVSYKGDFPTGGVQWKGNANSTIWGMLVGILNNAQSQNGCKYIYSNAPYNWDWDYPAGTSEYPYRLQDFCGYYPKAKGIHIQALTKDTERKIYISNTATETDKIFYSVYCGTSNNEVKFSDIEEVARLDDTYKLYLVISVYKKETNTLIGEYFNNGILLHDYVSANIDETYDINGCKMVSMVFKKSDFWGNSSGTISDIDVYLSLQTIKKESTPDGYFYHADKIIMLPYSNSNYFKESIKFSTAVRSFQAQKIVDDAAGASTRVWISISTKISLTQNSGTPDIMFTVSKIPTDTLTFKNGVTYLKTLYTKSDGTPYYCSGTLTSETGSNIPTEVNVPEADGGTVSVYYHFGDVLNDTALTSANGGKYPAGQYRCELFLARVTNGTETLEHVGTFFLYTK